ncbi:MAG: hypothetical protein ACYST3_08125 [Planctomycetota bacterium]|jgi:hypothetical protein
MKKLIMSSLLLCSMMFFVVGSVFAKPGADQDGPYVGNDMPSGPHANLNIHGKDPANFICPEQFKVDGIDGYWKETYDDEGNFTGYKLDTSIHMPEYSNDPICGGVDENGDSVVPQTIVIQSGKKGGSPKKGGQDITLPTDQIIVTDACTECIDGDPAEFQLPPCEAGYKVYGRALGKPADPGIRKIIISAGDLLTATDGNEQNLLELGEIIGSTITPSTAPDVEATREKGKPKTVTLSDLFKFTGTICYLEEPAGWDEDPCNPDPDTLLCRNSVEDICATDLDDDGIYDVIVLKDEIKGCPEWKNLEIEPGVWICYLDRDFNGLFDDSEGGEESVPSSEGALCPEVDDIQAYCQYYEDEWIFNIADLVEYYFGVVNDGVKLFQIRFYPIDPECFTSS